MRRRLELWWFAVVPATLLGHVLAYALDGRTALDAQHWYVVPSLELSLVVASALCLWILARALLRTGRIELSLEQSTTTAWMRLAPVQLVLFALLERAEGHALGIHGILAQLFASLVAAVLLVSFARLVARCERAGERAAWYIDRLRETCDGVFVRRPILNPAHALAVRAGIARFQRPPPICSVR